MAAPTKPEIPAKPPPPTARPGSIVVFQGWNRDEEDLHGIVASSAGESVTIAYLTRAGAWLSARAVPYDPNRSPGSWSWPKG